MTYQLNNENSNNFAPIGLDCLNNILNQYIFDLYNTSGNNSLESKTWKKFNNYISEYFIIFQERGFLSTILNNKQYKTKFFKIFSIFQSRLRIEDKINYIIGLLKLLSKIHILSDTNILVGFYTNTGILLNIPSPQEDLKEKLAQMLINNNEINKLKFMKLCLNLIFILLFEENNKFYNFNSDDELEQNLFKNFEKLIEIENDYRKILYKEIFNILSKKKYYSSLKICVEKTKLFFLNLFFKIKHESNGYFFTKFLFNFPNENKSLIVYNFLNFLKSKLICSNDLIFFTDSSYFQENISSIENNNNDDDFISDPKFDKKNYPIKNKIENLFITSIAEVFNKNSIFFFMTYSENFYIELEKNILRDLLLSFHTNFKNNILSYFRTNDLVLSLINKDYSQVNLNRLLSLVLLNLKNKIDKQKKVNDILKMEVDNNNNNNLFLDNLCLNENIENVLKDCLDLFEEKQNESLFFKYLFKDNSFQKSDKVEYNISYLNVLLLFEINPELVNEKYLCEKANFFYEIHHSLINNVYGWFESDKLTYYFSYLLICLPSHLIKIDYYNELDILSSDINKSRANYLVLIFVTNFTFNIDVISTETQRSDIIYQYFSNLDKFTRETYNNKIELFHNNYHHFTNVVYVLTKILSEVLFNKSSTEVVILNYYCDNTLCKKRLKFSNVTFYSKYFYTCNNCNYAYLAIKLELFGLIFSSDLLITNFIYGIIMWFFQKIYFDENMPTKMIRIFRIILIYLKFTNKVTCLFDVNKIKELGDTLLLWKNKMKFNIFNIEYYNKFISSNHKSDNENGEFTIEMFLKLAKYAKMIIHELNVLEKIFYLILK